MWRVVVTLAAVGIMVFSFVDVITIDERRVRYLPKAVWAIIVVVISVVGSVLWWTLGRGPKIVGRPAGAPPLGPDDDPVFLDDLEQRFRDADGDEPPRGS